MELIDLLQPDAVLSPLRAASKKQALSLIAARAAALTDVPEDVVLEGLMERERLGSTGVGNGIAIPHAKLKEITRLHGLFARLETPIPFDSIDDQPVDLIFVLLAPAGAGADHLKALSRVSRFLRNHALCDKLRGSREAQAIFALLTEPAASHAA